MSRKDFESTPTHADITYGRQQAFLGPSVKLREDAYLAGPIAAVEAKPETAPVAVLVCHGMGQQVRFETVGQLAASILNEARSQGCEIKTNGVQVSLQDDEFLSRAELKWIDTGGQPHEVHVYEAYWAPVTENQVTYRDTVLFLFQAAWSGIRKSRFLRTATFTRWMFGALQDWLKIGRATQAALFGVAAFLALQVIAVAITLTKLADQVRQIETSHFAIKQVLLILLPGIHSIRNPSLSAGQHWLAFLALVGWYLLVAEVFIVRYFLIQYVGDVAAYISPYKDSKFDSIRREIQNIGLDVAKVIYGFSGTTAVPEYERIVIAGHSLGSVLAYDTLNAIIACDLTSPTPHSHRVLERTTHLITFGSPLDKTAFLFRNQSNHIHDPLREQMAAAAQPLILDKAFRQSLAWTNLWSRRDVISGSLNYYDDSDPSATWHVQNEEDPGAWVPFYAHVQYWTGKRLASLLYNAVA